MHNFCDIANLFNATNLPKVSDLYAADAYTGDKKTYKWRNAIIRVKKRLQSK